MMLPLPYLDDPCCVYERLRDLGHAVLLDSLGDSARGRYDIIAAQPDPARSLTINAQCIGAKLHDTLGAWQDLAQQQMNGNYPAADLPFYGGYIGHLSYELGRRLQNLPPLLDSSVPIAVAHYYPWAVIQDRQQRLSWLVGEAAAVKENSTDIRRRLKGEIQAPAQANFELLQAFGRCWDLSDYQQRFEQVKRYVSSGDCYQINIGQPFSAPFRGDLFGAYQKLRRIAKAPFSGFFPVTSTESLLCLSPERFLTVDQSQVETRPIKGTRPRHADPLADKASADSLLVSDKERAENLMIVDLLRNDIGRYCMPGSVRADELFTLESYSTVHHLVSVVTGTLAEEKTPLDLLLGCMPGGSITGAPKHRAMQIIDELEPAPRQAWCGSLFYLSRHGRLDSNITIRTLFNEGQQLHCWAGGGLVDDSQLEPEYQEQLDKVGAFLSALESELKK